MSAARNILLLGKNGQVGGALAHALVPLGPVISLDRKGLDLAGDDEVIGAVIRDFSPDVIMNAAAYTAVDKAESEPDLAMRINGAAPGILAEEARKQGALLVHYSTDYVFSGGKSGPYLEDDEPGPINVYGKTKLAGERAIARAGGNHLILRTSWVYGAWGGNFLLTMLRLMKERETLSIVDDQIGAPTWARTIADTTAAVLPKVLTARERGDAVSGVYHLAAKGETSWHGFALQIAELYRTLHPEDALRIQEIAPIPSADYPTPAARPKNSRLDVTKLEQRFGVAMPDWREALKRCLEEMKL